MAISPRNHGPILGVLLLAVVLGVYSNHFTNALHFDDFTAIQQNRALRDPATIFRAFLDATLFSNLPAQQGYRPVVVATLTLDYWLGGGLNLFYFHLSTFILFCVLILLVFRFFRWIMDRSDPDSSNIYTAALAAAVFALHPACAETVNYIIQRADLYNTLGCLAGVWVFARYPRQRRFGWYLLPAVAAILSKPPALIFPLLLFLYVLLFETGFSDATRRNWTRAFQASIPALVAVSLCAYLLARMQPKTWTNTDAHPFEYWITQPLVALHYFGSFFVPIALNIDPGWAPAPGPFSPQALAGYLFVIALTAIAARLAGRQLTKPIAYGLLWFLVTQLPTALLPLHDITNDHRMFFPFVGLTLAACWSVRLVVLHRKPVSPAWWKLTLGLAAVLLVAEAAGTRQRNHVWSTEETVWKDSTEKNPQNYRAWENLASAFEKLGDHERALPYLQRAEQLNPNDALAQVHLVNTLMALHRESEAEPHFRRLIALNPPTPAAFVVYANWLTAQSRLEEAGEVLRKARARYSGDVDLQSAWLNYSLARDAAGRIAAIRVIDTNRDTMISAGEWFSVSTALEKLDRNHDGELSAQECGAPPQMNMRQFMQSQPLLQAIDTDHNGELSATEIAGAAGNFDQIDKDGDGQLESGELLPSNFVEIFRHIFNSLDQNQDGRIDAEERALPAGIPFRELLEAADIDGDGAVTFIEWLNETFYRVDRGAQGVVSPAALQAAIEAGVPNHSTSRAR